MEAEQRQIVGKADATGILQQSAFNLLQVEAVYPKVLNDFQKAGFPQVMLLRIRYFERPVCEK